MTEYKPLTINRTLHASCQAVWDAWTKPEQLKQWYMPAPFSVHSCELDVRVGGKLHIETQAPDGAIMPLIGEFAVVDEPHKLVSTNSPLDENGDKLFVVQHAVTLTEDGDDTLLSITSTVLSAGPNAAQFLEGMEAGLNQAFDQMATMLAASM